MIVVDIVWSCAFFEMHVNISLYDMQQSQSFVPIPSSASLLFPAPSPNVLIYAPRSSKGVKFQPLNHQKQTQGLKFDTLGGSRYINS